MGEERRQVPRYLAELEATLMLRPQGGIVKVKVANLSVTGCCVENAAGLNADQECELAIEWEGQRFRADSEVTWKSTKGEAGLRFLYIDQKSQDLLRSICSNLRLMPLVLRPED
jgi:hypothetical protein